MNRLVRITTLTSAAIHFVKLTVLANTYISSKTICTVNLFIHLAYTSHVHVLKYTPIKYSSAVLDYTRIGIGDPNNNTFYFHFCQLQKAPTCCFHILAKKTNRMSNNYCYNGSIELSELENREYILKDPLITENTTYNRVLMSRTDNLMPNFVNNLIKYLKEVR